MEPNLDDLLWESRIFEERAIEHSEWKMMRERQLQSQIERVQSSLDRQKLTNVSLRAHIKELDDQIEELKKIYEDVAQLPNAKN